MIADLLSGAAIVAVVFCALVALALLALWQLVRVVDASTTIEAPEGCESRCSGAAGPS